MEFKGLVVCRAGIGFSLILKIKLKQVINENKLPIKIENGSLDAVVGFNGALIITLSDVAKELVAKKLPQKIIGIDNIMDKAEILTKLNAFLLLRFNSLETAERTICGIEIMHMIRKGQVEEIQSALFEGELINKIMSIAIEFLVNVGVGLNW